MIPLPKKTPLRMCIGCQQMFDKRDLHRIVRTPEGEILLDTTGKKSGRGAYICSSLECFKKVRKSKKLEKSLKAAIPAEMYDQLQVNFHE
ncbi:MAG: RNase P modulator RnpM [Peptococcaceae bacterium]